MKEDKFYEVVAKIDTIAVPEPSSEQIEELFKIIQKDDSYENYFLSNVKFKSWLFQLKERGYFSPEKAPGLQPGPEKGSFSIPEWNVLRYLEQVSMQAKVPEDEKYIEELLNIIREVTQYHIKTNKLDNYRTWWYFVKILLNIPSEKIPESIIELIPFWLRSRFDVGLVGADIAKKLLPKFLNSENAEDWKKAERIVEAITAIKWLKISEERRDIVEKEQEATTLIDNYWLQESFKENAAKVGERCSEKVIFTIAERLKEVFRGEHPESFLEFEYEGKEYVLIVSHRKDFAFNVSVGIIKRADTKAKDVTEQLFKVIPPESEKLFEFQIGDCNDKESFTDVLQILIRKDCKFEKINGDLNSKIKGLYNALMTDYSYIWFESMFSGPHFVYNVKQVLTLILRDITLAKVTSNQTSAGAIFEAFLGNQYQYPIFKRMVVFLVAKEWSSFKKVFWRMIDEDGGKIFSSAYFEPELYPLLENNVTEWVREDKERLKTIIERGPLVDLPEDYKEKYVAHWKQKWYSALKSDPFFLPLFDEQTKFTGSKEKLPPRITEISVREGPGPSPLSKEQIIGMSNEELAKYLSTFQPKDRWEGPSIYGLSGILRGIAQEKPEKLTDELGPFLNTGYLYVYDILEGINEAWNKRKSLDWKRIFEFIKLYIEKDEFWQDKYVIQDDMAKHKWIVATIGRLIRDGTRDDAWAFSEDLLFFAQEILLLLLEKTKANGEKIKDAVNDALNSALGIIISALIHLALRVARVEEKKGLDKEPRWSTEIKKKYEELLKDKVAEGYILLGQYMPNLYYLDKHWVKEKIEEISLTTHGELWDFFMRGYLFGRVYKDLYELMEPHYRDALDFDFKESDINQRLVEHISFQYLEGKESISVEQSLFKQLLNRWDPSQIEEIIGFFWRQRDYLGENPKNRQKKENPVELREMRGRIVDFWRWIYKNKYHPEKSPKLTDGDQRILSDLSKLSIFLAKIDAEAFEWMVASAPYLNLGFTSSFLIEYLNNLKDADLDTGKYVGKILLKILETSTPDYKQENIRSIVEHLYQIGEKESADTICNIYGSRGLHFLRDLYEMNQQIDSD